MVNGQPYSTVLSQGEFSTLEPVPLKLGDNDITAAANTTSGAVFGRVTAVIEYDPLYNITVSNQFPQGLQMVSIPMTPFDDDPTAVFGSSLARWSSLEDGTPGYVYSGQDLERVTPYRGYWWKLRYSPKGHGYRQGLCSQQGFPVSLGAGVESDRLSFLAACSMGRRPSLQPTRGVPFLGKKRSRKAGCPGASGLTGKGDMSLPIL